MNIEAEGQELIVRNENDDIAIIPKTHRKQALDLLRKGKHDELDKLISGLPFMEDYAEDGTLVSNNLGDPPVKKTITKPVGYSKGLMTPEQYKQFENDYYVNPKYVKYSAENKGAGCVGSSCKNFEVVHPELGGFYADYEKAYKQHPEYLKNKQGIWTDNTGADKPQGSSVGIDAWEAADFIVHNKLGEYVVDANDKDYVSKLMNMDIRDVPIGSMLTFGDARGKYVNPKAKSWRGVEGTELTQHGGVVLGYMDDVDADGNPVQNIIIDDLGPRVIGSGKNAKQTWKTYVSGRGGENEGMRGIVKRYSSDVDYWKSKGQEKPKEITTVEHPKRDEVLKKMKSFKEDIESGLKADLQSGLITQSEYDKKLKENTKIPEDLKKELAQSIGLLPGNKVVKKESKKP